MKATLTAALIALVGSAVPLECAFSQDDCQRDDTKRIHALRGYNSVGLDFNYESRVEKDSSYSHKYIWCIENKSNNIADFLWGTREAPNLYFGASVRPGQSKPNITPNSSGIATSNRTLSFKLPNGPDFPPINPETVHYRGGLFDQQKYSRFPHFRLAQADLDAQLNKYKGTDGLIDLSKLSGDGALFKQFLEKEGGKLAFIYSSIATIPTNAKTLEAIRQSKYEKYDANDFADLKIYIYNYIQLGGPSSGPFSTIYITGVPAGENERARLTRATELPIEIVLSPAFPDDRNFPKELTVRQKLTTTINKTLLSQPSGQLVKADAILRIQVDGGERPFLSWPISLLVPGRGT